mgnify:CR=1 FL=1
MNEKFVTKSFRSFNDQIIIIETEKQNRKKRHWANTLTQFDDDDDEAYITQSTDGNNTPNTNTSMILIIIQTIDGVDRILSLPFFSFIRIHII